MTEPTPDPPPLAETHIILGEWMAANNSMLSSMQYDPLKIIIDGLLADRAAGRALEAVPEIRERQQSLLWTINAYCEATRRWGHDVGAWESVTTAIAALYAELESRAASPAASPVPMPMGSLLQRVMARLADLLDDDKFNNIQAMVEGAGYAPPDLCGTCDGRGCPVCHPVPEPAASPVPADMVAHPTHQEIAAHFKLHHGGPNPYYACVHCEKVEPGLEEYLVKHMRKCGYGPGTAATPQPSADMVRAQALEDAARACEKLAEKRFDDHGTREPDTGACYYGGRCQGEYDTRDEEDHDCAAAIRALATPIETGEEK